MPDLTLSFTKPNLLSDVSLHRCVRINRYQREKIISFVPPDGVFKLLSYRINGNTNMPIYVKPTITYGTNGTGRVECQVGSKNVRDLPILDVVIIIPLTKHLISSTLTANCGSVRQDPKSKVVRWEIGKMPIDKTPQLDGGLVLPPDFKSDERPTVRAEFQVKMYCASGLKVDGLAIRGVKYKPFKGVRSLTQAGRFQLRA
jgi:AP-3 complex subunit mu